MSPLAGTWELFRLALRRDRVSMAIWLVILSVFMIGELFALESVYPTTADKETYAALSISSAAVRMFGAIDGPTLGSMMMIEMWAVQSILLGLFVTFTIVRHTRRNEESGRLELVQSAVVGRLAAPVAALMVVLVALAIYLLINITAMIAFSVPVAGTQIMMLSLAGFALVAAATALLTAQIFSTGRGANTLAGSLIALWFLIRAVGDIIGTVNAEAYTVTIHWISWLSPMGWGELAYPFTDGRWGAVIVYPLTAAILAAIALSVAHNRDTGHGLISPRPGPAHAGRLLGGPVGLALRMQKTSLISWSVAAVVLGAFAGSLAPEVEEMLREMPQLADFIEAFGADSSAAVEGFYAANFASYGLVFGYFAVQSILFLRSEEEHALAFTLAGPISRTRWMASSLLVSVVGVGFITFAMGVAFGASDWIVTGSSDRFLDLVTASIIQGVAMLVLIGAGALGYGLSFSLARPVAFAAFMLAAVSFFAQALHLPDWALNISPFHHLPRVPAEPVAAAPILSLLAVACALMAGGIFLFRRRDIA